MERRGPPEGQSPYLKRFDKNRDGKISRGEFAGPERRFDRLDRNGDGYLQADEVPNPRNRNRPSNERGARRRRPGSETAGRQRARPGNAGRQRSTIQLGTGLEVVTVGTGSPLYNPERSRPCTMISFGGKLILVDLGEGTTAESFSRQDRQALRSQVDLIVEHMALDLVFPRRKSRNL